MAHEDEAVAKVADIEEVPSKLIAEAQLRHEKADSDLATAQEKKQAAVEQAHALSTRPDGSYAQLHEAQDPTLAVADEAEKKQLAEESKDNEAIVKGEKPRREDEELAKVQRQQVAAEAKAQQAGQPGSGPAQK
jgi:hypothetical protein